jgi:excisionase family DNA binding protein
MKGGDPTMTTDLMTIGEAQHRLGVSKKKIAQLIRDGELVTLPNPLDRRIKLVKRSDVEALAARGATAKKEAVA